MPEITTFFGPPGTGKTRALLDRVRAELDAGVAAERIAFVAFTRRAAGEAKARGAEELGLTEGQMTWWRTLHSTAARELGVGGGDLVMNRHWSILGDALGMEFANIDPSGRVTTIGWKTGHKVQSCYYLRKARLQSLEWNDLLGELGPDLAHHVHRFDRTLKKYKTDAGLMDYSDLIHNAPGVIGAEVVLVDEAQDLTAAQWRYVERLWENADRVYVGGDDEQAIFGWAGADVSKFLAIPGERVVLDHSYRLPRAAYEVARVVSERIRVKHPKEWGPADRAGEVHRAVVPDRLPLADGDWLLLSRTRAGLATWERACRSAAVRYVISSVDSVKTEEVRAIMAWERVRAGRDDADLEDLSTAANLTDVPISRNAPIWREALTGIPRERRLYYESCLRRDGRSLYEPATVRIDTIHGAKGAEATNVGLLPDLTPKIERGMAKDPDAEHRVWYVAVTRCKESLHIARPGGHTYYRGL